MIFKLMKKCQIKKAPKCPELKNAKLYRCQFKDFNSIGEQIPKCDFLYFGNKFPPTIVISQN